MEEDIPRTKGESLLPPATVNNSTTATSKGESLFKFDDVLPELDDLNEECFGSGNNTNKLLLGAHSLSEIKHYMDEFKIGQCLKEQGINEYYMELDTTDWYIHKLFIWMGQSNVTPKDEQHLLAEMWFRRVQNIHQVRGVADVAYTDHRAESKRRTHSTVTHITPRTEDEIPEIYHSHDNYLLVNAATLLRKTFLVLEQIDFIVIEWTRMQNPTINTNQGSHNNEKHEMIQTTNNNNDNNNDNNDNNNNNNDNNNNNNNNYISTTTKTGTTIIPGTTVTTTTETATATPHTFLTSNNSYQENKDPFHLLPGQNYPSLGIGRIIDKVLFQIAIKGKRDGILNVPLYFHNALFYQKENYHFVNPIFEGIYLTMYNDLLPWIKKKGLGYVAHALLRGLVKAWVTFEYVEVICKDEEEEKKEDEQNNNENNGLEIENGVNNSNLNNTNTNSNSNSNLNNNLYTNTNTNTNMDTTTTQNNNTVNNNETKNNQQNSSEDVEMTNIDNSDNNDEKKNQSMEIGEEEEVKSIQSEFESGDECAQNNMPPKKIIYQLPKKNNRPYATVRWKGLDMMYPISLTMKNFYNGKVYKKLKEEFIGSGVFWIDTETSGLLTEKDWQMAVYCNDVDTRDSSQAKFKEKIK